MTVYADNAATTPLCRPALEAMEEVLENIWGNPSALYRDGQAAKGVLEESRRTIARLLNANSQEIYFTSCGSESDNQAILTAAEIGAATGKKHIVSSACEHHAVLRTLEYLRDKRGFEITLVNPQRDGAVRAGDIENAICKDTCLVSLMHANNETGVIQPIYEVDEICKKHGVYFHVDAVQTVGHLNIDVQKIGCDFLSLSAHKFGGSKGIGALYAKRGIEPYRLIHGGMQERRKRAGTENVAAVASMAAALEFSCKNMVENSEKVLALRKRLADGLLSIPESELNGYAENRMFGNVNVRFDGVSDESLLMMLDAAGIEASAGSACEAGSLEPSHVLISMGLTKEQAMSSVRFTLSERNTESEIDYIIKNVTESVKKIRESEGKY